MSLGLVDRRQSSQIGYSVFVDRVEFLCWHWPERRMSNGYFCRRGGISWGRAAFVVVE